MNPFPEDSRLLPPQDDDEAMREYGRQLAIDGLLLSLLSRRAAQPSLAKRAPIRSRFRGWASPLAAAAGLLAVLGIGLWLSRTALQTSAPYGAVARVESVQGSVFGVQDADPRPRALHAGDEILVGMRIETGADSAATLVWLTEAATVELAADSKLETRSSKRSFLHQGQLSAAVGPQPPDQPFEVETPHALATVLGTRLRMQVGEWKRGTGPPHASAKRLGEGGTPAPSSQPSTIPSAIPFTRLDVEEGLVRIARRADRNSLDVAAGRFAVVGEDDAAFALKTYPADAEWVDGPVIFRDRFDRGLDRWRASLWYRQPDGRAVEDTDVIAEAWQYVRIREGAGRTPSENAMELRCATDLDRILAMRPLADLTAPSFAVEFDFRPLESFGVESFSFQASSPPLTLPLDPREKEKANHVLQRSTREGRWFVWRQEYLFQSDPVNGLTVKANSYYDGFPHRFILSNQTQQFLVQFSVGKGRVLIGNYSIREMIPGGDLHERPHLRQNTP